MEVASVIIITVTELFDHDAILEHLFVYIMEQFFQYVFELPL